MEVSILPKNVIRLKSKTALFLVNPVEKSKDVNAVLYLSSHKGILHEESVVIDGPGDYEIGGVKLSGIRYEDNVIYSLSVDGIDVLIGDVTPLEKVQHKVKEHDLVIIVTTESSPSSAAFATGLATKFLVTLGEKGQALVQSFSKENTLTTNKLVVTKDKLPTELQTVLLANS